MHFQTDCHVSQVRNLRSLDHISAMLRRLYCADGIVRPGATPGACLAYPDVASTDLVASFESMRTKFGFQQRPAGAIGVHVVASVSSAWIEEAGSPFAPDNPRNAQLLEAAVQCVNSWAGPGAVFCGRLSLDEFKGGIVHLVACPWIYHGQGHRIAVAPRLRTLMDEEGEYDRLQSAAEYRWHRYASSLLDRRFSERQESPSSLVYNNPFPAQAQVNSELPKLRLVRSSDW